MTIYSVSDVHIKYFEEADDVARREIFLKFLESIKSDADILILNGDIFDLWIEWKDKCIPEYMPIIEKL
jgi:UDP-2,3-diacylglucosamine hydrolase